MNGEDFSDASHDDTVKAFYSAQQPITVEVLRRPAGEVTPNSDKSINSIQDPTQLTNVGAAPAVTQCCSHCLKRQNSVQRTQGSQTDNYLLDNAVFPQYNRTPSPPPLIRFV